MNFKIELAIRILKMGVPMRTIEMELSTRIALRYLNYIFYVKCILTFSITDTI